jgi:methylenetetrahydrofolate dehydrogenase (NADP+)/methenyltetrahydrofolate cyclohydrolase
MSGAQIIDGQAFAASLCGKIAKQVTALKKDHDVSPALAVVLVGDDEASHIYVRAKGKQAEQVGMTAMEHLLPADTPESEVLSLIDTLNHDAAVSGILVQLPLPDPIGEASVLKAISPLKDIDGFHPMNVGGLWSGGSGFVPCTPWGCLMMLKETLESAGDELNGKRALVIGRSNIVGKPMAALLLAEHATVTIAHSRTQDLADRCRETDILVAAVGRAEMVRGDWIKPGATVIDVGINRIEAPEKGDGKKSRLVGDVAFDEARKIAGFITPVPGGVGPMTIACLMRNTVIAAARQNGLKDTEI